MKILKKLLIFFLAAIPILFIIHILIHTTLLEKEVTTPQGIKYTNHKWGYTVELSSDWERTTKLISQIIWLTNIIEFTNKNDSLGFQISYNEFYKGDNKDLVKFVQEDAKYGEQNQEIITETVEEISQTSDRLIVRWSGKDSEGYFMQYYIADKSDPENNIIHKLYFSSKEPFKDFQIEEVEKVLEGFNLTAYK